MTALEKLKIEHPEQLEPGMLGGARGCPDDYKYLPPMRDCKGRFGKFSPKLCTECWNRDVPEDKTTILPDSDYNVDGEGMRIKDSGSRREFETGAVRDIQEGKGRCDLLPLDVVAELMTAPHHSEIIGCFEYFKTSGNDDYLLHILHLFIVHHTYKDGGSTLWQVTNSILEVSKHFEEGAKKYGEYNWQKGIPTHCYIDSALRHYFKYLRGDTDEPHDRAFVWNILCCIWTCKHKPELNDYGKPKEEDA